MAKFDFAAKRKELVFYAAIGIGVLALVLQIFCYFYDNWLTIEHRQNVLLRQAAPGQPEQTAEVDFIVEIGHFGLERTGVTSESIDKIEEKLRIPRNHPLIKQNSYLHPDAALNAIFDDEDHRHISVPGSETLNEVEGWIVLHFFGSIFLIVGIILGALGFKRHKRVSFGAFVLHLLSTFSHLIALLVFHVVWQSHIAHMNEGYEPTNVRGKYEYNASFIVFIIVAMILLPIATALHFLYYYTHHKTSFDVPSPKPANV